MLKDIKLKTLLIILLVIIIPIILYLYLNKDKGMDNIKEHIKTVIPNKYEVIEEDKEDENGCTILYTIYPKEYTETERKYLSSAKLIYCEDVYKAVFRSQLEENKYDPKRDAWARIGVDSEENKVLGYYEQRYFGDNLVSIVERWGSGYSGYIYVLRMDNSRELVVLSIPTTSRIFCEEYYNDQGEVSWDKECIEFLDSVGMHSASGNDLVPQERYQNDYKELVYMLKDI